MDAQQQHLASGSLKDELNRPYRCDALARAEADPRLAEVYQRMAAVERQHAAVRTERLRAAGVTPPAHAPDWRPRTLAWAARRLGQVAAGTFVIGGGITLFTGRSVLFSGARQGLFGLAAAGVTFGIGRLSVVNRAG